ncbi:hypothetical protein [Gardnerella greenwoodii]|uniref:hypothetical protein n=1 Tax=Gardnerella greenwoodii TaxID=2914925 RepID=UPI000377B49E|nr:hypothetical protein [Gardnerella greenwoodii]
MFPKSAKPTTNAVEKTRQMFPKSAKTTTNAGKIYRQMFHYAGLQTRAQRDDLLSRCDLAREGNSERKLALEVQWTSNASFARERNQHERHLHQCLKISKMRP